MTTTAPSPARTRTALRFALHYGEMAIGMALGMVLLGPLWRLVWPASAEVFEIHLAVMATNMVIGMLVPMLLRRHSWRSIGEMSAAMYAAFLVVLGPYWLGLAGAGFVLVWGHVLMFGAMFVLMLVRPHDHGSRR
ncbi:hypothetical protein SAMN05443637_106106 [Pseudonocardia thermophila]|jgi:hypothetical protein|uniref:Flagellar biosynthetic protein FliP n=1 Tax=Pseudonocardia thermophila TaxID=1848 RepID=A0A1M6SEV1_PSETH|nr:hypothetical protein [Pseudonocardia thermophila]SHK43179.1 hypothetical protein SAMN05443637_106106 [Pseudonocardia thermophila]